VFTGGIVQAGLLLVARIWLSQAVFVHQIMAMMRATGFSEAPSIGSTLIQSVAPLLLASGLATRPVALLLLFGVGRDVSEAHLAGPHALLLVWLLIGGAGSLSLDFLLRGGLARVPVWAVRSISRLYAASDALGELVLPLGTRVILAIAVAAGTGFAMWPVPFTGELVTAPWWTILLCWALLLGLGTRPVALILCAIGPPIVLSANPPDQFEITLLLLLIAAKGAGKVSVDTLASCWAGSHPRTPDRRDAKVPHVVVVGGGFGGIAAVRGLRRTSCRITLIDRRNHHVFQPLLYQVATAALSPADIALPIRGVLRDQRNVTVRLGEVVGVDRVAREVLLPAERVAFDYLILATGARHSYFGKDEWAAHAPGLKSIEDATAMRSRMLLAFEQAESEEDAAKREAHHYGNLATIGRLAAVVEVRWLRLWGAPAWWLWGLAHVSLLTGGRNRATVVLNWLWAYFTYRRGTRLITGNTDGCLSHRLWAGRMAIHFSSNPGYFSLFALKHPGCGSYLQPSPLTPPSSRGGVGWGRQGHHSTAESREYAEVP
jgi:uncharacterized membrane protein YphA (DoxX/SURF4 family)